MSKLSDDERKRLLAEDQGDESIDFSEIPEIRELPPNAVRGKFYRPGVKVQLPVYLTPEIQDRLAASAQRQGVTLTDLVNDLLAREIAIAEAIRQ